MKKLVIILISLLCVNVVYARKEKKEKVSLKDTTSQIINVPQDLGDWCRNNNIEKVTIKAPMTDEQKADILRQVPTATVVQL